MPSIYYQKLRIAIYSNDHPPPHAHVLGPDWEIKIHLTNPPTLLSIMGNPKKYEARKSLLGVSLNIDTLKNFWFQYHVA